MFHFYIPWKLEVFWRLFRGIEMEHALKCVKKYNFRLRENFLIFNQILESKVMLTCRYCANSKIIKLMIPITISVTATIYRIWIDFYFWKSCPISKRKHISES